MSLFFRGFSLPVLVIVSLAAIGIGQQQPPPSAAPSPAAQAATSGQEAEKNTPVYESATVLKTTTRLVVVDVVATGKKGEAVTDLERADFAVLEDGKEQTIRAFSFQQPRPASGQAAAAPDASLSAPKLPDNVFTNAPRFRHDSALNVVLLDALNTTAPHQAYVREQMIKYLEKMPQGRPVAVYTLGSKLTLLQDFTSNPETLREAIKKLKGNISPLLDHPTGGSDEAYLFPPGAVDAGLVSESELQLMMRFEQERTSFQTDLRVTYTLNALNAIARALSGYPGRKNLIWISEAFPINIDPNMELTSDVFTGTRNYGPQIAAAADNLIDAQIAIYPVDAHGLEPNSVYDADNPGFDKFGRVTNGPRMSTAIRNEDTQLQYVHGAMNDMADRTGGKAFYKSNDIDGAIGKSMDDGSTYYTLAYYPENKDWNGRFRKIQVKVKREGVKLRYRLGYYAVDPKMFAEQNKKQQATLFGDALSLDSPVATGLRFDARVTQPSAETQNKVLVEYSLDPHAISFDYQADGLQHAQVDCVVQAYSANGKLIKTEGGTMTASLKPDTYNKVMHGGFPCKQFIDLPPGSYHLRLGVRDGSTGLVGTANGVVTVAQTSAGDTSAPAPEEKKQ